MSAEKSRKRQRAEEIDDDEPQQIALDFEQEGSDAEEDELIQVDFDFAAPNEEDYFAIKRALSHYLSSDSFSAGELADAICAQHQVGSVIKANDQVIGFVSAISMSRDLAPMAEIKAYCQRVCPPGASRALLARVLDAGAAPVGLIVNWRVANAPSHLAPFLHRALFQEIEAVAHTDRSFAFEHYLMVSRTYTRREESSGADLHPSDEPRTKRRKDDTDERHAFFFEEDLFAAQASVCESFAISDYGKSGKLTLDSIVDVQGRLLLFPASAVPAILAALEPYLDDSLVTQPQSW